MTSGRKVFDLKGTDDDELLRFYLKRAGLSDDIESLSPEVRKAFVIDIIKSNKIPGQWVPSTMRPPPSSNMSEARPSLERMASKSSLTSDEYQNRTMKNVPASPTTVKTSLKGSKYEISGPISFRHLDGDMHRDMTKNAFDLRQNVNDNVLKKYMIEKQISEEDLKGMRKRDIIKNIIQSQFTWVPRKNKEKQQQKDLDIKYATISINNEISNTSTTDSAETVFKFDLMDTKFADPSQFPSPEEIFYNNNYDHQNVMSVPRPPSQIQVNPYSVNNFNRFRKESVYGTVSKNCDDFVVAANDSKIATIKAHKKERPTLYNVPPVPPPKTNNFEQLKTSPALWGTPDLISFQSPTESSTSHQTSSYQTIPYPPVAEFQSQPFMSPKEVTQTIEAPHPPPPPPPPPPSQPLMSSTGVKPPPPPPPPAPLSAMKNQTLKNPSPNNFNGADPKDALLASIRQGVTLKKVDKGATISGIRPRPQRKPQSVDFLSELKKGITLRMAKSPIENLTEPSDESQA